MGAQVVAAGTGGAPRQTPAPDRGKGKVRVRDTAARTSAASVQVVEVHEAAVLARQDNPANAPAATDLSSTRSSSSRQRISRARDPTAHLRRITCRASRERLAFRYAPPTRRTRRPRPVKDRVVAAPRGRSLMLKLTNRAASGSLLVAAALILAACGGAPPTPTAAPKPAETKPTTAPAVAPPAAASPAAPAAASPAAASPAASAPSPAAAASPVAAASPDRQPGRITGCRCCAARHQR